MIKSSQRNPVIKNDTVQCDITANVQQWLICHMIKWHVFAMVILCSIGMIFHVCYVLYELFIQNMSGQSYYDPCLYCGKPSNNISHHNIVDVHLMEYDTITLFTEDNHKHLSEEEHYVRPEFKPLYFSKYVCIKYTFFAHYDIQVIKSKLVNLACQCNSLRKEEYRYRMLRILNNYHKHLKTLSETNDYRNKQLYGGGIMATWLFSEIEKYAMKPYHYSMDDVFEYGVNVHSSLLHEYIRGDLCCANVPLWLLSRADKQTLLSICQQHSINVTYRTQVNEIRSQMNQHISCDMCRNYITVFSIVDTHKSHSTVDTHKSYSTVISHSKISSMFPPSPPDNKLIANVINGYCDDITPESIKEDGCAICACLYPLSHLTNLLESKVDLEILTVHGVTRKERLKQSDPIYELTGPVIHDTLSNVCKDCISYIKDEKVPPNSLANGNWIGNVPCVLQNLSWVEKLLISRVCHNRCVVRVSSSGMHKLSANAVFFSTPMPKIYKVLPPSLPELDEVLAFVYLGPTRPTEKEFKRTPLLVHRNKVAMALEWLKLNHIDYTDLNISYDNLNAYPEHEPPVQVDYHYK